MNSLVNQYTTSVLPELSYGYVKKGDITKWIFWESDSFRTNRKFCIEINTTNKTLRLPDGVETNRVSIRNTPGFYSALGVDWLTKAMPNPQLFMDTIILEQVALRRITNPASLAAYILGPDLLAKVSPRLFFRSVLSNPFFDTWDKIKIAILILMVTENVERTLNAMVELTQKFNRNYNFYRAVNLCFKMGVTLNCFLGAKRIEQQIAILDKENKFTFHDGCYIALDGGFGSCIDLMELYLPYASSAMSIAEFEQRQSKSIYYGSLPLPFGMRLIDTPEELEKEGRRMSHCVGSLTPNMLDKKSFFLHVKHEVSATVEVVKNTKKRCFEVNQVKGVSNASVPASLRRRVKQAISSFDAQYFFFKNTPRKRKSKAKTQQGPTLFDDFFGEGKLNCISCNIKIT